MSRSSLPMFVFAGLPRALPAGYAAAPVAEQSGPVRVCVVVKTDKKAVSGPFVVLRETLDARVYLGCLQDGAGRVQGWLELWVQDLSGLANALTAYRGVMNNKTLDERWAARCEAFDAVEGGMIRTGWETSNPALTFIDLKAMSVIPAKDRKSGAVWGLCKDEALLASKGVPGYAASVSRHLYQPELGDESALLPLDVVGADPAAMGVGTPGDVAALNGGGGLMMVTRYCPLSYEQYVDAVTGIDGEAGPGDALLKSIASAAAAQPEGKPAANTMGSGGWLMLGAVGSSGRLVEALHLKLMVFAQAVAAVRAATASSQMPLLNVSAQSFRVRLGEGAGAVPLWWTAKADLVEPGEGVELPIEGTQAKYYLAGRGGGLTIYAPAGIGRTTAGKGWLRLRNVVGDAGGTILEGTLSTQERLAPGSNDLLWLRFAVGSTRVDLYATVDTQGAMGAGEIRIRTIPHNLSDAVVGQIKSALGVPIPEVNFEMVPLLSTPCDLYALGVLAVRTLLVGSGKRALPVALDELLSLAFQASKQAESGEDLATRLMAVFESDKRWATALGPQALVSDVTEANEAFVAIPPRLWFSTLAMVIRMFTGLSADSTCRDYGDAPAGGVHKVFDGVLDELYALLTACRSLIVSDYALNAEVRGVVQECLAGAKG